MTPKTFQETTGSILSSIDSCCREMAVATNPVVAAQWADVVATLADACAQLQFRRDEDE